MFNARMKPHGGIRPYSHKSLTRDIPIRPLAPPRQLVIPLRQHTGPAAVPVVAEGDSVTAGQLIAEARERMSAPVHSALAGVVTAVTPGDGGFVKINVGAQPSAAPRLTAAAGQSEAASMLSLIEQAGIVGMGGAMFPAADKIRMSLRNPIETLIVNGGECEPYLTTDDRLMREQGEFIIGGIRYLRTITQAKQVYIGIEDNKTEAIARLDELCRQEEHIEVVILPSLYPIGSAKQMIEAVTGRQIPQNRRSTEMGVLVQNVGTCIAIFHAIRFGKPMTHRVITVSGRAIEQPGNVLVPIGATIKEIIGQCGGLKSRPARMVLGGPMMGRAVEDLDTPINKGTSGLLLLTQDELPQTRPSACLRCGRCLDACPMSLPPQTMFAELKNDGFDKARQQGLDACLLCGSCAYVCPAALPLTQFFDWGQQQLRLLKRQEEKLERTRQNSANRQARLAKEAAEKAAALAAKPARRSRRAAQIPEDPAC
ncbi:electron transport complex subunit RsxC [Acerihabitans sp. KWT182]|uniref:Ion-translocating oxidoreductase complex subunit C n=1 Tax=Acerihabitans sp. KWT182 TaxID=3157919 RepID=A0AAU7Q4X4_9GAMM